MKITKAIEILKLEQKHSIIPNMDDWNDAIKLGIEALKRVETDRGNRPGHEGNLLPGETKE